MALILAYSRTMKREPGSRNKIAVLLYFEHRQALDHNTILKPQLLSCPQNLALGS
jgi:hypothetical protein